MQINSTIINLESLLDLSVQLNESDDEQFILNSALLSLMGKLKIFKACVLLPQADGGFCFALSKGRIESPGNFRFDFHEGNLAEDGFCNEYALIELGFNYCFPVRYKKQLFAVICLGERNFKGTLGAEETHYARLVCMIIATALQNARIHKSLIDEKLNVEKRSQLLLALFEMSRDFSSLLSRSEILRMLSYHLMGQLMVSRFAVFLIEGGSKFNPIVNRFEELPSESILSELAVIKLTGDCNDFDCSTEAKEFFQSIDARVFTPMTVQGSTKGLMVVGKKLNGAAFNSENLQFIEALSNTAIAALENERLFQEELNKKRLESEMRLALDIQRNLLPKDIPQFDKFGLAGMSLPSSHVGGDYYDFIVLSESELLFAIADVSGKGIPAALLMANVQAALRALAPLRLPLLDLIVRLNNIVYLNTTPDKFVTFFCGRLNIETGLVEYVNAGHNPPLLVRKSGEIEMLRDGGLILGFTDLPFEYEQGSVMLERGDTVVCYTDGVTEAMSSNAEEYGESRLTDIFHTNKFSSAEEVVDYIVKDVQAYAVNTPQFDDLTVAVVKAR